MLREAYHPNAYLSKIRNIKLGLRARTKILKVLDRRAVDAKAIVTETGLHYGAILHHLKLLESEGIVKRKGSRPYTWVLTGLGQRSLVNSS